MGSRTAALAPTTTDRPQKSANWIVVSLLVAPLMVGLLFTLLLVDASIGHDGLHCELGWAWSAQDNACGGFWR